MQRQVAAIHVEPSTAELPQTLLTDSAEDIPVVQQSWLPTVQTVQKAAEIPQARSFDKDRRQEKSRSRSRDSGAEQAAETRERSSSSSSFKGKSSDEDQTTVKMMGL